MSSSRSSFALAFLILALSVAAVSANAQCVSLITIGSAYTQNFDTLSNTAGSTTNNLTIPGWFLTESGGGARDNEQYAVDTGASTTGDMYSYGSAGSTERALGQLRSGTLIPLYGACFTNNTGSTLTSLAIAYNGEEWRLGTAGRTDQMNFEYSLNATDLVTGTWTNVAALNFVTPDTATVGAKNGNAAADRTAVSSTISSLSIANGATFWIRWNDQDASGADDGLAIDDFSLTPNSLAPVNLTINDVSLNEGNAGTTSFTFTVSLSAPAGPGGVTFDIATADGTATAPSDYTTKSLTAQTIPAGSSTYSFTVLVNGDTTPETNETFFVNVTNVTGATVTDGQGQGTIVNDDVAPNLTINDVTLSEGDSGTTSFDFTVQLSAPAPGGGVTFDIATANGTATAPSDYTAKTLTSQTIPAGSSTYLFSVLVNGDTTPETNETFFVNVTNVTNAIVTDGQGQGTIVNDDLTRIHDVQGNGASTPIPGASVIVEGIVVANFQGANKLQGFFLQEEDADADADPNTSEGIFIACGACPTAVAEGQRVRAAGTVSEVNNRTQISATTAGSVVITDAGNNLAQVTPSVITLPILGDVNAFYETLEGMLVTYANQLSVDDTSQLASYGQLGLTKGSRPFAFTEQNAPSVSGNTAWNDAIARQLVTLDDDNNIAYRYLTQPDGSQFVYHPTANGGLSVGTQGVDFFRGGDLVNNLTGVVDFSSPDGAAAASWRIRPTQAHPVSFTVANPRPAVPSSTAGAIKAAAVNLQNYFTTIDTTAGPTGVCGPSANQKCGGADSVAELNRQRERASIVICTLNADVVALTTIENTTASTTITDLLGAVNARCGGAHPYTFVNTGGTLGSATTRDQLIYRTGVVSPVGSPLVDLDPAHDFPPTAQTFDVVDATNPAFGQRVTTVAVQFTDRQCGGGETGGDADSGDGQGCWSARRTAQANELVTWINGTVVPSAGDPDVLLLGDFNSFAKEAPVAALTAAGYSDTKMLFGVPQYTYSASGQLASVTYAFASASLVANVRDAGSWPINADESDLFDYNDEVHDTGEAATEEKPDGSALTPPRVVFQPASPYRESDRDPVVVGLFAVADVAVTKSDSPDPVTAGTDLTYTIQVRNNGPDPAANGTLTDTLPANTTFVSLSAPGLSCTTPAVGSGGTVNCTIASYPVGTTFTATLVVHVAPSATGTISNTATAGTTTGQSDTSNDSGVATTTVAASADLSMSNSDSPDPVNAGANLTYTITATNAGPSNAQSLTMSDTLPAGTTFVSLASPGGWSCTTPAVGSGGTVNCTASSLAPGSAVFTLVVHVAASTAGGTTLSDTATITSSTTDPTPSDQSATATTTVAASADLSISNIDSPDPVTAGTNVTYTITVANAGPSDAQSLSLTDTLPAGTTFVSLASPGGWSCTTPAVGANGTVTCTATSLASGNAVFTLVAHVAASTAAGTILNDTATITSSTSDPTPSDQSATASTTVATAADLSVTNVDAPDPVTAGANVTYTITVANAGPSDAQSVALTDVLPAGMTFVSLASPGGWSCTTPAVGANGSINCTIATLAASGNAVFTLIANVSPSTPTGTVLSNKATVSTTTTDPTPLDESATATTNVTTSGDVLVTNTDSPDPVNAGANLTYTIMVGNSGPSDAQTLSLTDTIPANTTFVSLASPGGWSCTTPAPGGTGTITCTTATLPAGNATFTLVVNVGAATPAGTTITNTASVTTSTPDANNANNQATATTTVGTSADLSVTNADAPDPVAAGTDVTYTITVTNPGPSTASGLTLTDALSANTTFVSIANPGGWSCTTPAVGATGSITCTTASLASGANATFTVVAHVDPSTPAATNLSNVATVTSSNDSNAANNSATATTAVITQSDLQITLADAPDPVTAGTNLTYTISVTHTGPSNAANVTLADTLPATTTFVSLSSPGGWSCTTPAVGAAGAISCTAATFAGPSAAFTLVVAVDAAAAGGSTITDTVTVSTPVADPTPSNNTATTTTTVVGAASASQVTATKTVVTTGVPGSAVTYTIVITNNMPHAQSDNPGNEFTDVLPAQLTLVSASATSGTATATVATNTVTWNGSIPSGGSVTITINATIVPSATGTVSNQGTVAIDVDNNGTNETTVSTSPASGGAAAPTTFAVGAPVIATDVPTLSPVMLAALALMLAAIAIVRKR